MLSHYKTVKEPTIIIVITIFIIIIGNFLSQFKITKNISASIPLGYYLSYHSNNINKDDIVKICLSSNKAKYLKIMASFGLPHGSCPNGYLPILKQVMGIPGDNVEITSNGVLVNNNLINNSQGLYTKLQLVPPLNSKYKLAKGEYWVMGNNPQSFDARYFGVINQSEIIAKAILFKRN